MIRAGVAVLACRDIRCMCVMWYWGWREILPLSYRSPWASCSVCIWVRYVFGMGPFWGGYPLGLISLHGLCGCCGFYVS